MKSSPPTPSRGFTLIELLVVIAIIAILATVATQVHRTVKVKAGIKKAGIKRTVARNDARQLQTAIKVFYREYNGYPVRGNNEGPYEASATLMGVLISDNTAEADFLNPRKISYFEPGKLANEPNRPGFHAATGRLNDPWGRPYEIYVDADDDRELTIPAIYGKKFGPSGRIRKPIFVHSGGPDKNLTTVVDNLTSWD